MGFARLFIESTKPKVTLQKNIFKFLAGYFISIFYYGRFDIVKALIGLVIYVCVYSCVYVVNDVFDCSRDKKHPLKRTRPIPSGQLDPVHALIACFFIYSLGFIASIIFINLLFAFCISLLVLGNIAYSHPFFKTKKLTINAGLLLMGLQYLKLLAGWSVNAGEINHPSIFFMIPACLYLYCQFQVAMYSDHYKGRYKFTKFENIMGKLLMIIPAILITVLLFTEMVFYITFTIIPIYFAFLYISRKLRLRDAILKINKYMTYLNSLLISLNATFFLVVFGF